MIDNTLKSPWAKKWDKLTDADREWQRRMDADTCARINLDDHKMKQRARRAAIARISKSRKLSDDNFGGFRLVEPDPVWAFVKVTGAYADGSDWALPKDEYGNWIVFGHRFDQSAEDIINFCKALADDPEYARSRLSGPSTERPQ